jgi:hypothetical protein
MGGFGISGVESCSAATEGQLLTISTNSNGNNTGEEYDTECS